MRVFLHLEQEIAVESVSIENTVVNRRNHSLVKERICRPTTIFDYLALDD